MPDVFGYPPTSFRVKRVHQLESVASLSDDVGITDEPPIPRNRTAMCPKLIAPLQIDSPTGSTISARGGRLCVVKPWLREPNWALLTVISGVVAGDAQVRSE
jgi:hypothetical protein